MVAVIVFPISLRYYSLWTKMINKLSIRVVSYNMDNIPKELVRMVFLHTSIKTICKLCLVCKDWYRLTDNNLWQNVHLVYFGPSQNGPSVIWRNRVLTDMRSYDRVTNSKEKLLWAASRGYVALVPTVVSCPNELLMEAINNLAFGAYETVKFLLANNKFPVPIKSQALWNAAATGQSELCELLVNAGADINHSLSENQQVGPLWTAVNNNHLNTVQTLLYLGANPDLGFLLHRAVYTSRLSIVKALCEIKPSLYHRNVSCNLELVNESFLTPLNIAVYNNEFEILEYLLSRGANVEGNSKCNSPLIVSVDRSHNMATYLLIKSGAKVNYVRKSDGVTPLYIACRYGQPKVVSMLLSAGADPHLRTVTGDSPLHIAIENSNVAIVKLLLTHCPHLIDNSLLTTVIEKGQPELTDLLLSKGADVDYCDTALFHQVCKKDNISLVKILLKWGRNPNSRGKDGNTVLHNAVSTENIPLIKLLLAAGTQVNIRNDEENTPLHVAIKRNNLEIVKLLVEGGANLNLSTGEGESVFDIAKVDSQCTVLKYLGEKLLAQVAKKDMTD